MRSFAVAIGIVYNILPWGVNGDTADFALNDIPLPQRTSAILPTPSGVYWTSGSTATLVFGDLSAEDTRRLSLADGTTGTLTIPFQAIYLRPTGSISYNPSTKTLVFTLNTNTLLNPFTPFNPQL